MSITSPPTLPPPHRQFIRQALSVLPADPRIIGLAAAGSYLTGAMDEFSDLDLIIVTEPDKQQEVLADRMSIAKALGHCLAAFTGEHVGESRLLIALYGSPLLHVDLKFVCLDDLPIRVEEPAILWQRDGRVAAALAQGVGHYPQPGIAWMEARFWVWVHYAALKIGRGELFEAIDTINLLRAAVLGPLALSRAGARPQGVRRIETSDPGFARALQATVPACHPVDCLRALGTCIALYRDLRSACDGIARDPAAEQAVMAYVEGITRRVKNPVQQSSPGITPPG